MARFHREAQILAAFNHPHIAHIYGLETVAGVTALVMEMVEGLTLADRIAAWSDCRSTKRSISRRRLPTLWKPLITRASSIATSSRPMSKSGRRSRQGAGFRTRQNARVFLRRSDPALTAAASPAITRQGLILGTAAYMAPEQARGKQVDRRADIWSFACVVYEMLTGTAAFSGESVVDTLTAVLEQTPAWD